MIYVWILAAVLVYFILGFVCLKWTEDLYKLGGWLAMVCDPRHSIAFVFVLGILFLVWVSWPYLLWKHVFPPPPPTPEQIAAHEAEMAARRRIAYEEYERHKAIDTEIKRRAEADHPVYQEVTIKEFLARHRPPMKG